MKKLLFATLIIALSFNAFAGVAFNIASPVQIIEGDTITIDIVSDAGGAYCVYLDCNGAIITEPIPRPAAGTTDIYPNLIPEECGYDLCTLDPMTSIPGTHWTFTLVTNVGNAGATYTLDIYDETYSFVIDSLVVNVVDCMQAANVDIDNATRYTTWIDAGKPECWCKPRQCHGDAASLMQGTTKTGFHAVGTDDLNTLLAAWFVRTDDILGLTDSAGVPAACANFDNDNYNGGVQMGGCKSCFYHVGTEDLNVLLANWMVKEAPKGPGVPADCFPGNR